MSLESTPQIAASLYSNLASIFLLGVILAQMLLNVVNAICSVTILSTLFIHDFGDWPAQYSTTKGNTILQFVTPFITALTQGFYTFRTYSATKNVAVLSVLVALILGTLATGIAECGIGLHSTVATALKWVQVNAWMSAFTDVAISGVFIFGLLRMRKPVSDKEYALPTHSILGKLLVMSFETATLTSAWAIINAVFSKYLAAGSKWGRYGLILSYTLPNVQVISVLFTLNARRYLRDGFEKSSGNSGGKHFAPAGSGIAVTLQTFVHSEAPMEVDERKVPGSPRDWHRVQHGNALATRQIESTA
ncbi:hypothetical protein RQP46_009976 [Phenoliferia psychrophenolica]